MVDQSPDAIEQRRRFLKLGAAGLPMVLTVRAGAAEALVSQLRCAITLAEPMQILVDKDGAAWAGPGNVRINKPASVQNFKDNASYVYPAGVVPQSYWPDGNKDYRTFKYKSGYEVNPDRHLDGGLNWRYRDNKEGLYVALSVYQAENQANGAWPGVSCLVSILNYVNTQ